MTHVGQEFAFGPASRFCCFLGKNELFFGLPPNVDLFAKSRIGMGQFSGSLLDSKIEFIPGLPELSLAFPESGGALVHEFDELLFAHRNLFHADPVSEHAKTEHSECNADEE